MISNNLVCKVRVQAHTWRKSDWPGNPSQSLVALSRSHGKYVHIGEQTHTETRQRGNGGGGSHQVTVDLLHAEEILGIGGTEIYAVCGTDTGSSRIRGDAGIDGDDVGHGEEGG